MCVASGRAEPVRSPSVRARARLEGVSGEIPENFRRMSRDFPEIFRKSSGEGSLPFRRVSGNLLEEELEERERNATAAARLVDNLICILRNEEDVSPRPLDKNQVVEDSLGKRP